MQRAAGATRQAAGPLSECSLLMALLGHHHQVQSCSLKLGSHCLWLIRCLSGLNAMTGKSCSAEGSGKLSMAGGEGGN